MTLADRIADVLVEQGPMPVCDIATTVQKQKTEVIAALNGNPDRFVHNGRKARASRWDVREASLQDDQNGHRPTFTAAELGTVWRCSETMARTFLFEDEGFLERGFMESVDGNGRVRVTELGIRTSLGIAEMRTS